MSSAVRLVGLDVARCLALLGMVTTHMLMPRTPEGAVTWEHALASGRSAALFAVLAGVTLALQTGRRTPLHGRDRWVASVGVVVRAALIALLGLALAELDSGIAIILTYYGVLFLLGLPFAGLPARTLGLLAGAWLVVAPVVSHLLRPQLPEFSFAVPNFEQLQQQPLQMLSELSFTGYYPVVPWLAYLLAGMAIGRSDLASRTVQAAVLGVGLVLAAGSTLLSGALTESRFRAATLEQARTGMYGTTPTGDRAEWLLIDAPHSATPFDLAHTIGTAAVVIGACLLLVGVLPRPGARTLAVVFGAGAMTLSLYSLHIALRTQRFWPPTVPDAMLRHVLVLGAIGAVFVLLRRRGPLEVLVSLPGRLLRTRFASSGDRRT